MAYRKPYRIKRKKLILGRRFFRLGILLFILVVSLFYFLFLSAAFQIKKIVVAGEEKVFSEEIKQLIPLSQNIFLLNLVKVEKDILNKFPQIAKAEMSRSFPDTLNIIVVERFGAAVWCEDRGCFLIDNEGVVFEEAPPETDLLKIIGGEEMIQKAKLRQILELRSKLQENLKISVDRASMASDGRLNMETSGGWQIYFNLEGDLEWQATELSLVLEKQIPPEKRGKLEYIDLRFSRVYYRYR